jgi:hypothetical protein
MWDAGTAFEAYLIPTGAEGYQEVSVSGTETTYTDKGFLSSAFAGLLQVRWAPVHHAHMRRHAASLHAFSATAIHPQRHQLKPPCVLQPQVTVLRATGLPAADITGRSDPYVVLSVGDSSARTRVVNQELNPVWNETHILYVK